LLKIEAKFRIFDSLPKVPMPSLGEGLVNLAKCLRQFYQFGLGRAKPLTYFFTLVGGEYG